jgi:hypothetical protein
LVPQLRQAVKLDSFETESAFEKLMSLRHSCTALRSVVSSKLTKLKTVRAYSPFGPLQEVLQTAPFWWTATTKSIEVTGIVLGMQVVHRFGMIYLNLTADIIVPMRTLLEVD